MPANSAAAAGALTSGHSTVQTSPETSGKVSVARLSSAEYVATEIKRHKMAVVVGFLALLITMSGIVYFSYFRGSDKGAIDSLAVLPFKNDSADPETEYLADGITESIIYS